MQYSPKLKKVMEELKEVLKLHDVACLIVLHEPGFSEYFQNLTPSYACTKLEGNYLRIRAKLVEDFNGDKDKWTLAIKNTYDMISALATTTAMHVNTYFELQDLMKTVVIDEGTPPNHTSHAQQNN